MLGSVQFVWLWRTCLLFLWNLHFFNILVFPTCSFERAYVLYHNCVCVSIYIYIYIYIHTHTYIYTIYIGVKNKRLLHETTREFTVTIFIWIHLVSRFISMLAFAERRDDTLSSSGNTYCPPLSIYGLFWNYLTFHLLYISWMLVSLSAVVDSSTLPTKQAAWLVLPGFLGFLPKGLISDVICIALLFISW